MNNGTNNADWNFPPSAQHEYAMYLESIQDKGNVFRGKKTLPELFRTGEGKIVIPRRRIPSVSNALAQFGI